MLNFGIIGDVKALEKEITQIRKRKDVQIIGKSSVGIDTDTSNIQFSIPEFNKVELIDRSDALMINNFSLLSFSTLCDIIKKSKHIFATEYPALSQEECTQLVKLTAEAGTVFLFSNPFYGLPAIQWLNENLRFPALLDISHFSDAYDEKTLLIQLLLMLKGTTGLNVKKAEAVSFRGEPEESIFQNLNFQFTDASVVNINFGQMGALKEFTLKGYARGQFIRFDFNSKKYTQNDKSLDISNYTPTSQLSIFVDSIQGKKHNITQPEDYLAALETIEKIEKKLIKFSDR